MPDAPDGEVTLPSFETLAGALAMLQTRLPRIGKDQAAVVPTKAGGAYGYKYADLATVSHAVLPLLGELGLSFTALPTLRDDPAQAGPPRFVLVYSLRHTSGEQIGGEYPLPVGASPQVTGSAITYARRYCLCAVTGVAAAEDDDDAQAAERGGLPVNRDGAVSRSRTTEEQKARAGVMTSAQQAEHTALQPKRADQRVPAERATAPDPDDPWQVPPERTHGSITSQQKTGLHAAFGAIPVRIREDKLAIASAICGRIVSSSDELSYVEAETVTAKLREIADGGKPSAVIPVLEQGRRMVADHDSAGNAGS